MSSTPSLTRYAWLSVAAALLTIAIKAVAFLLTDSIGLLSDALESGVNLVAAIGALTALHIAVRPPDESHAYGHGKVEFFSSGAEGALILIAAASISVAAIQRLLNAVSIEHVGVGLALSTLASLVNLIVGQVLLRVGRRRRSIALIADGQHLMTDVWTSVGVLLGVGAAAITGWAPLDPLVGLAVAAHIALNGIRLLHETAQGLIDPSIPPEDHRQVVGVLERFKQDGIHYHALRTRQAGARSFISMHIQVPGEWTIQHGHDLLESIEQAIHEALPSVTIFTHIEPFEDPRSWGDEALDRDDHQPSDAELTAEPGIQTGSEAHRQTASADSESVRDPSSDPLSKTG